MAASLRQPLAAPSHALHRLGMTSGAIHEHYSSFLLWSALGHVAYSFSEDTYPVTAEALVFLLNNEMLNPGDS